MPSYLVTGASRGLGLGFVNELMKDKKNVVIATARDTADSKGLQELKTNDKNSQLILIDLDVSKLESVRAAAEKTASLLPKGLDYLISNAGVSYNALKSFEEMCVAPQHPMKIAAYFKANTHGSDFEELTAELNFTVTAPLMLVREFRPLVGSSTAKQIMIVTSSLGSIELSVHMPGLANGYSVARAALNMLTRKWSPILKNDGITISLLHPGWSGHTEIGGSITEWVNKNHPTLENLEVEKSASNCMKVLHSLTIEDSGAFFNHDGTKLPF